MSVPDYADVRKLVEESIAQTHSDYELRRIGQWFNWLESKFDSLDDDTDDDDEDDVITQKRIDDVSASIDDLADRAVIIRPTNVRTVYLVDKPPSQMPEPDWTQAPDEAQWWAVDANCLAYFYEKEPYVPVGDCRWYMWDVSLARLTHNAGKVDLPLSVDWRTTLRRRPVQETE